MDNNILLMLLLGGLITVLLIVLFVQKRKLDKKTKEYYDVVGGILSWKEGMKAAADILEDMSKSNVFDDERDKHILYAARRIILNEIKPLE